MITTEQREERAKGIFQAAMKAAHDYYTKSGRIQTKLDRWLLCASAEDNAMETAKEHGFTDGYQYPEYYTVCLGTLESILCEGSDRKADLDRKFFHKFGVNP